MLILYFLAVSQGTAHCNPAPTNDNTQHSNSVINIGINKTKLFGCLARKIKTNSVLKAKIQSTHRRGCIIRRRGTNNQGALGQARGPARIDSSPEGSKRNRCAACAKSRPLNGISAARYTSTRENGVKEKKKKSKKGENE